MSYSYHTHIVLYRPTKYTQVRIHIPRDWWSGQLRSVLHQSRGPGGLTEQIGEHEVVDEAADPRGAREDAHHDQQVLAGRSHHDQQVLAGRSPPHSL